MKLQVGNPGLQSTVQDQGRWGWQSIGMAVSGAMDLPSLIRGNLMVGNDPNDAALEAAFLGPELTCISGSGSFVLTGADLSPKLNGSPCPNWTVLPMNPGDRLTFGPARQGCRCYICLSGGVNVPVVMGSRSTYMKTSTGGIQGRALRAGDRIVTGEPSTLWDRALGFVCPEELRPHSSGPLRIVLGLQEEAFTERGIRTLLESEYQISALSDRMGFRLEGPPIEHSDGADIVSDGVPLGAVQVAGDGQPIVMMADRQTTGGYTKIGVLCSCDTARLAQKPPGSAVTFASVSQEEAVEILRWEVSRREQLRLAMEAYRATFDFYHPYNLRGRPGTAALWYTLQGRPLNL